MIAKLKSKSDTPWFKLMRAAAMAIFAMVLVFSCASTASAEGNEKEFSFYKISSAASMYYDDSHNVKSSEVFESGNLSMENAGNFVGFIDEDYGDGFIGSTVSFLSSSQQTRGYSSFSENALRQYVEYGHALNALGLDSTANETFDFGAIIRIFGGLALYLAYSCALIADVFFGAAIKILQTFNPFAWFVEAVSGVGGWFANLFGETTAPNPDNGLYAFSGFDGLRNFITGWYDGLFDLGLTLTALLFLLSVGITLLAWNSQKDKMKTVFRTFVTRALFICLGVPLLGGLYTATLDMAAENTSLTTGYPAANQVLMSTLIDFESWAADGNLALPNNMKISVTLKGDLAGNINAGNTSAVRELTRAVNNKYSPAGVSNYDSSDFDWGVDLWGVRPIGSSISGAYDVIGRYMGNAFYHASDYETAYKKNFAKSPTKDEDEAAKNETEQSAFYHTVEKESGDYKRYDDNDAFLAPTTPSGKDSVYAPYMNDVTAGSYGFDETGDASDYKEGRTITFKGTGSGGLSSLSMYNYLSTSFKDSSVITYSAKKATSGMVVESHHSVNIIGDGAMAFLYYTNMISMFWAISVIGLVYCFGLVFNMFGRGIKMVSSIPFAMLGNMRAMSKVCTIVAMMIIEILGTFFVYSLVIELLISLQGLVETPINDVLNGNVISTVMVGAPSASLIPYAAASLVGTLLSTVFYFIFGLKAIKWRKSIIKAIDEAAANVIDRIFSPNPNGGVMSNAGGAGTKMVTKPSLGDKAKDLGRAAGGAVMAGAGMAAGQALAAKAGDKLGFTAGSTEEVEKDGTAENAGGANEEEVRDGGQIQGAERQGLPLGDGPDGTHDVHANPSDGDSGAGQAILAANADSLGDLPSSNGVDGEVNGVAAGDAAQAEGSEYESNDVNVSDDDIKNVDAGDSDTKQLAADAELARATGQTSAMEDERDSELKKKERKEAGKDAVKGVAKTAEGVAKGAAGYATGDAQLMAEGAKDGAEGVAKTAKAGKRAADADTKVDSVRARKTEQKNAQGQGATKSRSQQNVKPANGQNPSQSKPTKGHTTVPPAGVTKATSAQQSSMKVDGGKSSVVNNGGTVNVNAPKATQQQAAGQKSAQSVAKQKAKAQAMSRRQAELKRAEKVLAKDGKVTLSNGKVVRNMSELRNMQRNTQIAEKALQDGITHATTVVGMAAAKSLTDKKKKDDDGFF